MAAITEQLERAGNLPAVEDIRAQLGAEQRTRGKRVRMYISTQTYIHTYVISHTFDPPTHPRTHAPRAYTAREQVTECSPTG